MSDGTKFAKKGLVISIALLLVIILMAPVAQGCGLIDPAKLQELLDRRAELFKELYELETEASKQRRAIVEMETRANELERLAQAFRGDTTSDEQGANDLQQQLDNKQAEIDAIEQRIEEVQQEIEATAAILKALLELANIGCFPCDTLVVMADNSLERIGDVQVGEMVLAYDVDTGQTVIADVTATNSGEADHYYLVNGNLKVTPPHPFFTAEGKWVKIVDLKVGDKVRSLQGLVEITSIEKVNSGQRICNIGVRDFHNFFVSANGKDFYLVHE